MDDLCSNMQITWGQFVKLGFLGFDPVVGILSSREPEEGTILVLEIMPKSTSTGQRCRKRCMPT
jgi:hypothetical protein